LTSNTNFAFLEKFCFVSEDSQVSFRFEYPEHYGIQTMYLYYDAPDQWMTVYKKNLTCEQKIKIADVKNNQAIELTTNPEYPQVSVNCIKVQKEYNLTWIHCSGNKSFISARPRWWYFAIANCNASEGIYVEYSLLLLNDNDPKSWHYHVSFDEYYCLLILLGSLTFETTILIASVIVAIILKSRKLYHTTYKYFVNAIIFEIFGIMTLTSYYVKYSNLGITPAHLKLIGRIIRGFSSVILLALLLIIGKGLTVTRGKLSNLGNRRVIFVVCTYALLYLGMLLWSMENFNPALVVHSYESYIGYMLMSVRILAWVWFIRCCIITIKKYPSKTNFYFSLIGLSTFWFWAGLIALLASNFLLDNWVREEVVLLVDCLVTAYGHTGFLILTMPSSASKHFPYHVKTTQIGDANFPQNNYEMHPANGNNVSRDQAIDVANNDNLNNNSNIANNIFTITSQNNNFQPFQDTTNNRCYTYDEKKRHCFKKSAITDSKRQYFMKSGIKANAYNGQGARLRNIKLKGGKPNIIEFDNLRECESFCHAYGMCTWSAKSEPLKQSDKKGICTCFKQIDHISYCFGTNSSIIPNSPDV
uniref:GpcrRhopsn4 domain-containing protein n=1 Tax=Rhabditophanes sp. KR3021 TaxID=114890 RepID=A0AC35U632_9BILA